MNNNFIDSGKNFTNLMFDKWKTSDYLRNDSTYKIENERYIFNYHLGASKLNHRMNFQYNLNKYGFRTVDFESVDFSKNVILTAGCSITFGLGLPEENRWTSFLETMIKDYGNDVTVVNLGLPGSSIINSIRNIMTFILKFGKPKSIIAMFPDVNRDIYVANHDNMTEIMNVQASKKSLGPKEFLIYYNTDNAFFHSMFDIFMLEQYCKAEEINLIWTTWSNYFGGDRNRIKDIESIKNYVELPYTGEINIFDKFPNTNNLDWWDYSADDHPGGGWQHANAKFLFDEIVKKNYI